MLFRVGLTGGIGSGKTQVANWLGEFGATIVDTDAIAHALTSPNGLAIDPIRTVFGDQAIDAQGAMDRTYMRGLVFEDPDQRHRLEGILHPLIGREVESQAAAATGHYVVFVVPLLVESGRWIDRLDRVCVVDCDEQTQISRVQARSGLPEDRIKQIMAAQATRPERLAAAHHVIHNGAEVSMADLRSQVLVLHQQWCNLLGCRSNASDDNPS